MIRAAAVALLAAVGGAYAIANDQHPDSEKQPLDDGCNRSQLALLGEAFATQTAGPHPTGFSSWVYVDGDNMPKTLEGQVLGTHTAGTDLFGVHDTYDLNIDVKPDPAFEQLLSTRNAAEKPGQIHTEWESGLAPLFAWPSPGDRVRETGSEIWDCGHWQDGGRKVPEGDFLPGDPLGDTGVEHIGGEEIEIHPIMELATWRHSGAFVNASGAPVNAARLDVAISNQGGKAKGVEECALLAPSHPTAVANRVATGEPCSTRQAVAGRDYTYRLDAPGPAPSPTSQLIVEYAARPTFTHHAPDPTWTVNGDYAQITVPFSHVDPASDVQDFGGTWRAYWSDDATLVHRFTVKVKSVEIDNNLDVDSGDTSNPSVTPEGEWNMYVDRSGRWTNLHNPRDPSHDYIPELGAVPSAKTPSGPVELSGGAVPDATVVLPDDGTMHLFTDARECDQPGYVDCPTKNELATTGKSAGRTDISLPVAQLLGKDTMVTIHPPVCQPGDPCPEEKNPSSLCPDGCYAVTFEVIDTGTDVPAPASIVGDGTAAGTTVDGAPAAGLPWWIGPMTTYAVDQGEENVVVARVIDLMREGG